MKKYIIKRYFSVIVSFLFIHTGFAQTIFDLRMNEVLPKNVENFEDDFGVRNAWFEVFNSAYGTIDIGGCFLTNDINNPTKYPIPKGDVLTRIKPRQHVLFWADNKPTHGTFHVNFKLEESNFIALFSSDGKTLVDSISFPTNIAEDTSFGRVTDGDGEWMILKRTTPSSTNVVEQGETANQRLLLNDPSGIIMALTAMSVVFSALAILFIFFKLIGRSAISMGRKRAKKAEEKQAKYNKPSISASTSEAESGEICAAIMMALHTYLEDEHDIETTILTIQRVKRSYSPWSSKIYALRETPLRRN